MTITLLETREFEEWEGHLSQAIGHHRSSLLTPALPFLSRMRVAQAGSVSVVAVEGQSSVRLHRHQPQDRVVLWLPRQGWVEERVNGISLIAEPGTAMLCLPGDELLGDTSPSLQGYSVVLPFPLLGDPGLWQGFRPRHLTMGSESMSLISIAMELVASVLEAKPDSQQLVAALADQLLFWRALSEEAPSDRILGPIERRQLLGRAREWMEAHLDDPFLITDLANALHISTRSLQSCFREELGQTPLEEARRLRFRRLRHQLRTTPVGETTIEAMFQACGLTFSTATQRHYRQWCGETPAQSQSQAGRR